MLIEFSQHALDQLRERGISKLMVVETVRHPDEVLDSFRGRQLFRRAYNGLMLEVVVVREDNRHVIVTEYFYEDHT